MCGYNWSMIRWSWTQTATGNWICQSGKYIAVAEWQGAAWEIRVKTDNGISTSTRRPTSPAKLESTVQHVVQDLAKQAGEMYLLDYEPPKLGWR